jgi:hypothetical protein
LTDLQPTPNKVLDGLDYVRIETKVERLIEA